MEKITGTPHRHENARIVREATQNLRKDIGHLNNALQPYSNSEDPLIKLMEDVFNSRQMMKKSQNGHSHD